MSLTDRIAGRLGYIRRTEAAIPHVEDEPAPTGMSSYGYRGLGADARPFSSMTFHQMVEKAWTLYTTNPLANRIISIRTQFIVDDKSGPVAALPQVQAVLDAFWNDPINNMPKFIVQAATQLLIFGTQVYPVFVNLQRRNSGQVGDGLVRLGYVDPANTTDIILDPDNSRIATHVLTTAPSDIGVSLTPRSLRVVHPDLTPSSLTKGLFIGTITDEAGKQADETGTTYDGACCLFRINNLMNSKWGWSDLLPLQSWLDQANIFFTDIVQHIYWLSNFVWDVQVDQATDATLKARKNEIRANPPARGSVLLHNEREKWTAVTPDLRQEDISSASRTLIWWIAGIGAGIPEHWLGWGRETTRATAKEMQSPTMHMLRSRQLTIQDMIHTLCRFQIDQAIRAKVLPTDINTSFTVRLPSLLPPDILTVTTAFRQLSMALSTPAAERIFPPDTAERLIRLISDQLAFDLTPVTSPSPEEGSDA